MRGQSNVPTTLDNGHSHRLASALATERKPYPSVCRTCLRLFRNIVAVKLPPPSATLKEWQRGMRLYHLLITSLPVQNRFEYPGFVPAITLTELFYNFVEIQAIMVQKGLEKEATSVIPLEEAAMCCNLLREEFGVDGIVWAPELKPFVPGAQREKDLKETLLSGVTSQSRIAQFIAPDGKKFGGYQRGGYHHFYHHFSSKTL